MVCMVVCKPFNDTRPTLIGLVSLWAGRDLNPRLPPCEDGTLTAELLARTGPIPYRTPFPYASPLFRLPHLRSHQ